MLNTSGLNGHSIRLFQEQTDDAHLERMFRAAADFAPSLVVIEDIDRAFPRMPLSEVRCKVSLQQLLNCLDGVDSQDGVIVVATANDPRSWIQQSSGVQDDLTELWHSPHRIANSGSDISANLIHT